MIRPTWKPTAEQERLIETARLAWEARDQAEAKAWEITQELRRTGVPDLAICERIEQVSKATLNRRLGPRPGPED